MSNDKFRRRDFIKTTALALPMHRRRLRERPDQFRAAPGKPPASLLAVRNGRFELRGRPYFYVGTNLWYGCYLCDPALPGGRQRLVRELDRLQSIGVNNIRLLAGSETSPLAGRDSPRHHPRAA